MRNKCLASTSCNQTGRPKTVESERYGLLELTELAEAKVEKSANGQNELTVVVIMTNNELNSDICETLCFNPEKVKHPGNGSTIRLIRRGISDSFSMNRGDFVLP